MRPPAVRMHDMNDSSTQRIAITGDVAADAAAIAQAAARLRAGALAVIPTDTVYGLAAHPDRIEAVQRLFAIKGRAASKAIPLLIAGPENARARGAQFSAAATCLATRFWPGALTLVLPVDTAPGHTEGFRVPDCATTQDLLRAVGGVLRVTSANRSGEPPAATAAAAIEALGDDVDLVLDNGPARGGVASTVVRVCGETATILRAGAIGPEALRAAGVQLA